MTLKLFFSSLWNEKSVTTDCWISESRFTGDMSSTPKSSFYYKSQWEKDGRTSEASTLSGDTFEVAELELSCTFFAHRVLDRKAIFEVVKNFFDLVTCPEINSSGDLTVFWKFVNELARSILVVHPHWEGILLDIFHGHYFKTNHWMQHKKGFDLFAH